LMLIMQSRLNLILFPDTLKLKNGQLHDRFSVDVSKIEENLNGRAVAIAG